MYDILYNLLDHVYDPTANTGQTQQLIIQACLALIVLILIVIIDRLFSMIFSFLRGRGVK